jgi:predicted CXXCH cytochrome family protein
VGSKSFRSFLAAPLIVAGGLLLAAGGVAAQETCLSAACHEPLLRKANVHAATESCDTCHQAVAAPHPQPGAKTFALTQAPAELCANCHDAFAFPRLHGPVGAGDCLACHTPHASDADALLRQAGDELCFGCHGDVRQELTRPHVHAAAADGCTSCHSPHGAAQAKLLAEPSPGLCFRCHDDVAQQVKAPVAHAAIDDGCGSCHAAHAADQPKLLRQPEKESCLGCHPDVVTPAMTVLHGPIREGQCTACHAPHGAGEPKLLVKGFPVAAYVPYDDREFELCFSCHDRDLLQYRDTSFATGFRNGEKNLHYVHVHTPKGRSCKLCHELHGADNPSLIAASVPFGQWRLPLKFVKTATGGACAPGCHKPYAYDREVPGRQPPAAAAGGPP